MLTDCFDRRINITNEQLAIALEDAIGILYDPSKHFNRATGNENEYSCNAVSRSFQTKFGASSLSVNKWFDTIMYNMANQGTLLNELCLSAYRLEKQQQFQNTRALWLTLLAELAERGELTVDGLV